MLSRGKVISAWLKDWAWKDRLRKNTHNSCSLCIDSIKVWKLLTGKLACRKYHVLNETDEMKHCRKPEKVKAPSINQPERLGCPLSFKNMKHRALYFNSFSHTHTSSIPWVMNPPPSSSLLLMRLSGLIIQFSISDMTTYRFPGANMRCFFWKERDKRWSEVVGWGLSQRVHACL